jgi:DNA polymerase III delta prime subunit
VEVVKKRVVVEENKKGKVVVEEKKKGKVVVEEKKKGKGVQEEKKKGKGVQEEKKKGVKKKKGGVKNRGVKNRGVREVREVREVRDVKNTVEKLAVKAEVGPKSLTQDHWVEVCRPVSSAAMIGRTAEVARFKAWLASFDEVNPPKPMFLMSGPPGAGKTTLAHLGTLEAGYTAVEVNASEFRGYHATRTLLDRSVFKKSLFGKGCLIFDEIDGAHEGGKNSVTAITEFLDANKLKQGKIPIVATCNSIYSGGVRKLMKFAVHAAFRAFTRTEMMEICRTTCSALALDFTPGAMADIVDRSDGDARQVPVQCQLSHVDAHRTDKKDSRKKEAGKKDSREKDIRLNMYDATRRCLTPGAAEDQLRVAVDVLSGTGHLAGGLMLTSYVGAIREGGIAAIAEMADVLSDYDIMNNHRYQGLPGVSADEAFSHEMLSAGAQAAVAPCPRGHYVNVRAAPRAFFRRSGEGKEVNPMDQCYVDAIVFEETLKK